MPSPELRVPVDVIRREAELAVAAASLRIVAKQIGISAMCLRAVILGEGQQQKRTLRKLNAWHAQHAAARGSAGASDLRSALIVIGGLFPQADKPRVEARVLAAIEGEFRESGMTPPAWLATLRAELRRQADGGDDTARG